jgi:hypothetical protein
MSQTAHRMATAYKGSRIGVCKQRVGLLCSLELLVSARCGRVTASAPPPILFFAAH